MTESTTPYAFTTAADITVKEQQEFSISCPQAPHLRLQVLVPRIEREVLLYELLELTEAVRRSLQ